MKFDLYMATSVNGMIAKENHETPWSNEELESFRETVAEYQALIIGRRTYEIMKEGGEFSAIENPLTVVLSNQKMNSAMLNVVSADSLASVERILAQENISAALVAGGSQINALFLKASKIDEITLDIEPMIFGKGIPLLSEVDLELLEVKQLSKQLLQLRYRVL